MYSLTVTIAFVLQLTSLAMTMKGLPSTYNKDLQEDKSLLFKSIELISSQLLIAANVMSTLKVENMY